MHKLRSRLGYRSRRNNALEQKGSLNAGEMIRPEQIAGKKNAGQETPAFSIHASETKE
jgi:hypothetical protein